MRLLCEEIDGSLTVATNGGTIVEIEFACATQRFGGENARDDR